MARRFVLLDRDGTINVERHYLADPNHLELYPEVIPGLRRLKALNLGLVLITNQSGIARGYFTPQDLDRIHHRLADLLAEANLSLDGIYVCPHGPNDGCRCRKPAPGLALAAADDLGFDPSQAYVIGDKSGDIELARNLGATSILVCTGYGEETLRAGQVPADHVANNLLDAANWIAQELHIPHPETPP